MERIHQAGDGGLSVQRASRELAAVPGFQQALRDQRANLMQFAQLWPDSIRIEKRGAQNFLRAVRAAPRPREPEAVRAAPRPREPEAEPAPRPREPVFRRSMFTAAEREKFRSAHREKQLFASRFEP